MLSSIFLYRRLLFLHPPSPPKSLGQSCHRIFRTVHTFGQALSKDPAPFPCPNTKDTQHMDDILLGSPAEHSHCLIFLASKEYDLSRSKVQLSQKLVKYLDISLIKGSCSMDRESLAPILSFPRSRKLRTATRSPWHW